MSMISKQIDELRSYAKDRKGELAKLVSEAADTIESLSGKLYESQMERSSQYYHGGWIPCEERQPGENGAYLVTCGIFGQKHVAVAHWNGRFWDVKSDIIAWRLLPEPANREGK